MKGKYKDVKKIIDYVSDIESTCDEYIIKQIICVLTSRLLSPAAVQETAGLMAGLADAEQDILNEIDNNKTVH
mgnify:CR=1 FL=1